MLDDGDVVAQLNRIHDYEYKSMYYEKMARAARIEFDSRHRYTDGILNTQYERYVAKSRTLKNHVIDAFKTRYAMRGVHDYEVTFRLSPAAGAFLDLPICIICSPVNLVLMNKSARLDKGRSCSINRSELEHRYSLWLNDNPYYEEWFDLIETEYDSHSSSFGRNQYSDLDELVELDANTCIVFSTLYDNSPECKEMIKKWIKRFDPALVQAEEIWVAKKGYFTIIRGLRFKKGRVENVHVLNVSMPE